MAGELLIFDAAASNVDGTDPGTALNVGPGTLYGLRAFDAPAPAQTFGWAGSVDTEGALPASRKHENRQISVTVLCQTAAALKTLQVKVGKITREGGTLKWVLPTADTVIFDLHSADTFAPRIDKLFYVRTGGFCEVSMTLPARPYGRGASVTLSTHTASDTKAPLIFTETSIAGDVAGLGSLLIGNTSLTNKNYGVWGVQSRYYSSDTQNGLLFQGEDGAAIAGAAANAGASGASGGGSNKVMRLSDVGLTGASSYWPGGGAPTLLYHVGTFRVFARAQPLSANTGVTSLRLSATLGGTGSSIVVTNDWTPIQDSGGAVIKGTWVLVDLGQVTLTGARVSLGGPGGSWFPAITAKSTVATDDVDIDWIALVPVNEGSGEVQENVNGINGGNSLWVNHERVDFGTNSIGWGRPQRYEGSYLTVPPAGAESRSARFIVILTGDITSLNDNPPSIIDATTLDAITATLTYTPRYLVVPSA